MRIDFANARGWCASRGARCSGGRLGLADWPRRPRRDERDVLDERELSERALFCECVTVFSRVALRGCTALFAPRESREALLLLEREKFEPRLLLFAFICAAAVEKFAGARGGCCCGPSVIH